MFGGQVKIPFKRTISQFIVVGLSVIFLVVACGRERTPDTILTEQQMVEVLTDLYLMEEMAGRVFTPYDSARKVFPEIQTKLFEQAGIPDSIFRKSMEYYLARPKKLEYIYTALVDSLHLKSQSAPLPK